MEYRKRRFKKSPEVVGRIIGDEAIIVPVNSNLAHQDSIYNLDPAGAKIWQMLDGRNSVAEIIGQMVKDTVVSAKQAEQDLEEFLKDLEDIGAIEEVR